MINIKANYSEIINKLEGLGKLEKNFKYKKELIQLLNHKSKDIRVLSIKNLAKLRDIKLLKFFEKTLKDEHSLARREGISAIGRLKDKKIIKSLVPFLKDSDPNIVLQSLRALEKFKNDKQVLENISKLKKHKNEQIKKYVRLLTDNNKKLKDDFSNNQYLQNIVVEADVVKTLKLLPDNIFDLVFTSPPYYNARDYSIYSSYEGYLNFLEKVFKETYRTTRTGRFFILNTSPVITPRISRKYSSTRHPIPFDIHHYLMKMGWVFIDDIIWAKPEASVGNRNGGFFQHRKPLGYKPNSVTEYVMVYRKGNEKLIDWNMKKYSKDLIKKSLVTEKYESSNLWQIPPSSHKVHSATFPYKLCEKITKLYSYKDDLLFDPFGGVGTFAKSAIDNDRNFFFTELQKKYVDYFCDNFDLSLFSGKRLNKRFSYNQFKNFLKKNT